MTWIADSRPSSREPGADRSRRLCAVLGHELRNPLASAVTNVSLAAAMLDDVDPRVAHLQQALGDLTRLSNLLSTYLEFGSTGRSELRRVDAAMIVRSVANRSDYCRFESRAERAPIRADSELLGRALENMIENAQQAGATEIVISLDVQGDAVVIDVVDDGPGIPEVLRETLFEPFVSGRNSTGLGLAVANDAVEQSGGELSIQPQRGHSGAAFRIVLPLAETSGVLLPS